MSSIQGHIKELKNINTEIVNLNQRLKLLRQQKKTSEDAINNFLVEKEQPGVKYQGMAITLEEKKKREYKNKKEKTTDGKNILEKYGVDNPDQVLNELLEAMRGDVIVASAVKIRKLKE